MGSVLKQKSTMKTIIAFVALLAVATADTCTDCKALVSTLGAHLVSEHSLAEQDEIMVGGLCPQAENVAECEEQLPNFWESIALILWPAYYAPEVSGAVFVYLCICVFACQSHSLAGLLHT